MSDQTIWDAIVVGGGPGGAITAKKLAEAGLKTLLIERRNLPRHKTCSGLVSAEAQDVIRKEFGVGVPHALMARPNYCKGVRIGIGSRLLEYPATDDPPVVSVWRRDFDYWLVLKANEHGAEVWDECSLVGVTVHAGDDGNRLAVRVKRRADDGRTMESLELTARYLIGADGSGSIVRGSVYPETRGVHKLVCYQEYLEGTVDLDDSWYYHFPDRRVLPGTSWCEMKDGLICIGMGYTPELDFEQSREQTIRYYQEHYNLQIRQVVRHDGCIDLLSVNIDKAKQGALPFYFGKDEMNVLLVGDAAEIVDVLGEGIHTAMRTGQIAAQAVIDHARGEWETPVAALYRERVKPFADMIESRWLKWYQQFRRYL